MCPDDPFDDFNYDPDDPNDAYHFVKPEKSYAVRVEFRDAIASYAKECKRNNIEIRTISDQHSGFFEESGWSLRALSGEEVANVDGMDCTLTANPNQVGGVPCH